MADRRLAHRLFIIGFVAAPLAVLAALTHLIVVAFERGPSMSAAPVGAGAGRSGGANAIGEAIFGESDAERGVPAERTPRGVVVLVEDRTGISSPDRPVVLFRNWERFAPEAAIPMERAGEGLWRLRLPPPGPGQNEPLAFRLGVPGEVPGEYLLELDPSGTPTGARRLPRVPDDLASGETPLEYTFVVRSFGES
jgi:hypothetical protein